MTQISTYYREIRFYTSLLALFSLFLLTLRPTTVAAEVQSASLRYAEELSNAFEQVAETITPSLVYIEASAGRKQTQRFNRRGRRGGMRRPFQDFFNQFPGFQLPQQQQKRQGLGSGVIVDNNGHILTNNHVIEGFEELKVTLSDKRKFPAKVVGTDPSSDLAVIKIDVPRLTPAKLGSSSELRIGEWVVAAGTPFGLENTITTGIVSAKGRSFRSSRQYQDYIQTDAAINPGNSGGPLVNLRGEVIGINNAIYTRSGGYMGIGFAIPIDMARNIMKSIIDTGSVRRGWLGVAIQDLTEQLAKSFNYPGTEGALIGDVSEDSPAEKAGLQSGDIIIRLDGVDIEDTNQLRNTVASKSPGTKVPVDVIRNGRKVAFKVKLGELPSDSPSRLGGESDGEGADIELGLDLEDLTPNLAEQLDTKRNKGVIVARVYPGSIAADAGLRPGDIILQVGDDKVTSVREFRNKVTAKKLKRGVRLVVETGGMKRFLFLEGGE